MTLDDYVAIAKELYDRLVKDSAIDGESIFHVLFSFADFATDHPELSKEELFLIAGMTSAHAVDKQKKQ
jgi:hypothetical protein